jgi:hypothetical protein
MIAAIIQAEGIRKMLRHLKRAADPPPLAPARARHATFDWVVSWVTCVQRSCIS